MGDIITAEGLVKRYKDVAALDGLDLAVPEGSVLGLLGPNGAGKTTAVRILATLLIPDEGRATVAGADVVSDPTAVRKNIGLSGQYAAVDEYLTGFENLEMIGRLYRLGRKPARERARALLERFDLVESGDRPVKGYSGGMRRRLDLAGALVAAPPILFLDEPTTGLDPRSRNDLWDVIRELVAGGTTLLLTTQYLEEADQLADQILVIDHGKSIALGTAEELKTQFGGERIEVTLLDNTHTPAVRDVLARHSVGDVTENNQGRVLVAPVSGGVSTLSKVLAELESSGAEVSDIGLRHPTLDDVFLSLTGRPAEDAGDESGDERRTDLEEAK